MCVLVPAIYYAHLASNRARAHENVATSEGPRGGQKYEETRQDQRGSAHGGTSQTGSSNFGEALPLLPLGNPDHDPAALDRIRYGMCKFLYSLPLFIKLMKIPGYI